MFSGLTILVQAATGIENFIIHSEDDLDKLSSLRLLYFDRTNKLEELWHLFQSERISEEEASDLFFTYRKSAREIEEIDNKLNVRKKKNLEFKADQITGDYLNKYYHE